MRRETVWRADVSEDQPAAAIGRGTGAIRAGFDRRLHRSSIQTAHSSKE